MTVEDEEAFNCAAMAQLPDCAESCAAEEEGEEDDGIPPFYFEEDEEEREEQEEDVSTSQKRRRNPPPTDESIKESIMTRNILFFNNLSCACVHRNCYKVVVSSCFQDVLERLVSFWGALDEPCPKRKKRREKCFEELQRAYREADQSFKFMFGRHEVCEECYVHTLGLSTKFGRGESLTRPGRTWIGCRDALLHNVNTFEELNLYLEKYKKKSIEDARVHAKISHALAYIQHQVNSGTLDTSPYAGKVSSSDLLINCFY